MHGMLSSSPSTATALSTSAPRPPSATAIRTHMGCSRAAGATGDLVLDFVNSARKHCISPGLYYSLSGNFYLAIGDSQPRAVATKGQRMEQCWDIVFTQVGELWQKYGHLAEICFDGDAPFVHNETTRGRIAGMTTHLQPHAILHRSPDLVNGARKDSEGKSTTVADPNWYACPNSTAYRRESAGTGVFMPAEDMGCAVCNGPSRQWFWHPDHDVHAARKPVGLFVDEYHTTALAWAATLMLMGFTANRSGLVPTRLDGRVSDWLAIAFD